MTRNPFAEKQATPYAAGIAPEMAEHNNSLKAEALRRALKAGLLGLAGGAGMAGVLGLPQLLRKPKIPSYPLQTEVELPYPQVVGESDEEADRRRRHHELAEKKSSFGGIAAAMEARRGYHRGSGRDADDPHRGGFREAAKNVMRLFPTAAGASLGGVAGYLLGNKLSGGKSISPLAMRLLASGLGWAGGGYLARKATNPLVDRAADALMGPEGGEKKGGVLDSVVKHTIGTPPGEPTPTVGSPQWLRGDSMTSVNSIPWAVPAAVGAAGAGLYGGHALVRHLLKKKRKAELEAELQKAQQEYEQAMLSQYDPSKLRDLGGHKEAAAHADENTLDHCFDVLEKRAHAGLPSFNDLAGGASGLYLTGAGMLGLGAGIGTYKWLESRSKQKVLKDALKRRALLRSLANPEELYVRPVPVKYVEEKEQDA